MARRPWLPAVAALVLALLSTAAPGAAVRPPRLQYKTLKLDNGLTLILSEDHSVPIVHLQIWYHVGSKDERPGRTGFAHLFEHLMFKGTRKHATGEFDREMERRGTQTNAATWVALAALACREPGPAAASHQPEPGGPPSKVLEAVAGRT